MSTPTDTRPPITSPQHPALKELRKLHRRREREQRGRFVAEGEDLLAAADRAGWPALERFCAAGSGLPGRPVAAELLAAVSTLGSGTRAVGVYKRRLAAPRGPLCVYLHGVSDPGNVGAVLRSALAFGASAVALGPACADPFGPRAVRASMGAVFEVALAQVREVTDLPGRKVALMARRGGALRGPITEPVSLLFGSERGGLPDPLVADCDELCHLPMPGSADSLNVAMAVTVALYELHGRHLRMAPR